jgi:DNA-binding NarL/FixJ family response regulator
MGTSIFIIDQERTFADALAVRLEAEEGVEVVVAVHRQAPAPSLIVGRHADVVLLDGDLPGNAAIDLCAELRSRCEAPRVIMLSHGSEAERIADAVRAGAAAWVRKSESLDHLLQVIQGVIEGETWLPPAQLGIVLQLLVAEREQETESDRLLAALTPREREVLSCLADGAGRRDVAERLQLSTNTVRTHLQNLLAKLGVHSALEAVALTRSQLGPPTPGSGPRWPAAGQLSPTTLYARSAGADSTIA